MKTLTLVRDVRTTLCNSGWLSFNGKKWATLERPWIPGAGLGGLKGRSCIPAGEYRLLPYDSEAHPRVWALHAPHLDVYRDPSAVPVNKTAFARTCVLIHVANYVHELRGCIAIGKTRERENGQWVLRNSRDAINELRTVATGSDLCLVIEGGNE